LLGEVATPTTGLPECSAISTPGGLQHRLVSPGSSPPGPRPHGLSPVRSTSDHSGDHRQLTASNVDEPATVVPMGALR
jgi:hypothetical protein